MFYFHWIISLLGLNKQKKAKILIFYIITFFFLLFSFSPLFVKDVEPTLYFSFWPKAGWLYSLYLIFIYFSLVIYSVVLLLKYYKYSTGLRRAQIRYVLLGSILGFGGGATNFFLWYDIKVLPLGNILVVLYPILFSYSIIKHRLMDIKFVLRKSYVYLASLSSIIILATIVKYILIRYFFEISLWADLVILILAILVFPAIKDYFYRLGNKYFFSSLYDSREVIAEISDKLRTTLEARIIYDFIYQILTNAFHVKAFGLLIYNEADKNYLAEYNNGFTLNGRKIFAEDKMLTEMFIKKNQPIITEDASHVPELKGNKYFEMLNKVGVEILAPLNVKDKISKI